MDVVIFEVAERLYAVAADTVREIIEPVRVTSLPFVAAPVEGLINVSGQVMVQISAARRLGGGGQQLDGAGVVMIFDVKHQRCACRVSRVCAKTSIEDKTYAVITSSENDSPDALIMGEFVWNDTMVLLLDAGALIRQKAQLAVEENGDEETGLVAELADETLQQYGRVQRDEFSCVVFGSGTELFALRFEDVAEVVESGALTTLPGAPSELAGIMLLRGEPLPLVTMNMILCGASGATAPFVVVVWMHGYRIGLLVERVIGIRRFATQSLRPLAGEGTLLEGFVTTAEDRVVALLRFDALTAAERFERWRVWLPHAESLCSRAERELTTRLLLFRLGSELMALPLATVERIEEYCAVTVTPEDVSSSVSGVIQVQGTIIPVHPLEQRMGLESNHQWSAYLIVAHDGNRCAVPVQRVERVFDMAQSLIEPCRSGGTQMLSGIGKYNGALVSLLHSEWVTA